MREREREIQRERERENSVEGVYEVHKRGPPTSGIASFDFTTTTTTQPSEDTRPEKPKNRKSR